jgi:hypothetical protein
VTGRIVERSVGPSTTTGASRPGRYFEPRVTYDYTVDGKPYQGHRIAMTTEAFDEGKARRAVDALPDSVEVHYDPSNPADAVLQPSAIGMSILILVFGAIAVLVGGGMLLTSFTGKERRRVARRGLGCGHDLRETSSARTLSHHVEERTIVASRVPAASFRTMTRSPPSRASSRSRGLAGKRCARPSCWSEEPRWPDGRSARTHTTSISTCPRSRRTRSRWSSRSSGRATAPASGST